MYYCSTITYNLLLVASLIAGERERQREMSKRLAKERKERRESSKEDGRKGKRVPLKEVFVSEKVRKDKKGYSILPTSILMLCASLSGTSIPNFYPNPLSTHSKPLLPLRSSPYAHLSTDSHWVTPAA